MPKISIIMPVYNTAENYFREAIESALQQTFSDFELLIIDDCSKPYIKKIVKSYDDKRIKYSRLSVNSGASKARNVGIDSAKGSLIAFLDSDDVWLPTKLEKQVHFLDNHPEIGCLGTKAEIIGNDAWKDEYFAGFESHEKIEFGLACIGCVFLQSTVVVRKSILDNFHIRYQTKFVPSEDYGLYIDLLGKTKFQVLPSVLAKYRFHLNSISHKQREEQGKKFLIIKKEGVLKYFTPEPQEKEFLTSFILGRGINYNQVKHLEEMIQKCKKALISHGLSSEETDKILKKKIKDTYYHTHSLKTQAKLLFNPIARHFGLSFLWRLGCFITRGII